MLATLFLISSMLFGQFIPPIGEEKAYEGVVVLRSDQVITGTFYFNEKSDLLYQENESGREILPPYQLKSFYFYDTVRNLNRHFIMLPVKKAPYPYQLYEVVVSGEVMVLRKRKEQECPLTEEGTKVSFEQQQAKNYHYFMLFKDELLDIRQFARKVYQILKENEGAGLHKVLKENRLNMHNAATAVLLIKEYNSLRKSQADLLLF